MTLLETLTGQRRVLVFEDDHEIRGLIDQRLTGDGFRVSSSSDGSLALDHIARFEPELVVLDLGLGSVDGMEILRAIRRTSDVPVIIVSGRTDEVDRVVGLEAGADDYVTKPFSTR